ncbi:uncharacterized protein DS421_1g14310 [Arachis hypogaea]|nr:uncharacterized protein DS421_1g14310 [Arachis hypogaea]
MPKKSRKVLFTEQDSAKLLESKYDATTVLTLLQELAHYPHAKIVWNELVKNTSIGIFTAREYQMVWHHLTYHHTLAKNLEDGAQPLLPLAGNKNMSMLVHIMLVQAFRAIYLVYGDYVKSWYTKGPERKRNIDVLLLES